MSIKQLKHQEFVAWAWASTSTIAFFAVMGFLHWWCLVIIPFLFLSVRELFKIDKTLKKANRKVAVSEIDKYTYRVIWSGEDKEYVGLCIEFPSLSWLSNEPEEALSGIREQVAEVIADMKLSKETMPNNGLH